MLAAKPHDFTFNSDQFNAEQIIGRQPIFQTMHPARIFRHIATNGTGNLAGWVGGIIKAIVLYRMGDGQIGHARLGHNTSICIINIQNAVEFPQPHQHRVGQRQGPTRERCAGSTWHHFDALCMAKFHHRGELFNGFWQHHCQRQLPIGGQPISVIGPAAFF